MTPGDSEAHSGSALPPSGDAASTLPSPDSPAAVPSDAVPNAEDALKDDFEDESEDDEENADEQLPSCDSSEETLARLPDALTGSFISNESVIFSVSHTEVDLMGLMGAFGPFLVDGSALFREVAANEYIDWEHGGQFLQAVYVAEKFLAQLLEKGTKLVLFFFEMDTRPRPCKVQTLLCVQLLDHLRRVNGTVPELEVHELPGSWMTEEGSAAFLRLLQDVGPACVLTDFARSMPLPPSAPLSRFEELEVARSFCFICWLRKQKLSIVSLEELNLQGPRVRAYQLQPPLGAPASLFESIHRRSSELQLPCVEVEDGHVSLCRQLVDDPLCTSQRLVVGTFTLLHLTQAAGLGSEVDLHLPLCAAFCVALALQETLPLQLRRIADEQMRTLPDLVQAQLPGFLASLQTSVAYALVCFDVAHPGTTDGTLPDVLDGRLLHYLLGRSAAATTGRLSRSRNSASDWLPEPAVSLAGKLWERCSGEPLLDVWFGLFTGELELGGQLDCADLSSSATPAQQQQPQQQQQRWRRRQQQQQQQQQLQVEGTSLTEDEPDDIFSPSRLLGQSGTAKELLNRLEDYWQGRGVESDTGTSALRPFQPHHSHTLKPLDQASLLPDAFQTKLQEAKAYRELHVGNHGQLHELLGHLSQDGYVKRGKSAQWLLAVKQRGATFRLASYTDATTADAPVSSLAGLEALCKRPDFPITLKFSFVVSAFAHSRTQQKGATKEQKFIDSLLQGAPVEKMSITELTPSADLARKKEEAEVRLRTDDGGKSPKKENKTPSKNKVGPTGASRKSDLVRAKVQADQEKKIAKSALEQVDDDSRRLQNITSAIDKADCFHSVIKKAKTWWAAGAKQGAMKALLLCLKVAQDLDQISPAEKSGKRWTFLALQTALRVVGGLQGLQDGESEGQTLASKLSRAAIKHLRMPRLAAAMAADKQDTDGKHKKSKDKDKGKDKDKDKEESGTGRKEEACPYRFQLGSVPEHLARPVGDADSRVKGFHPDTWQKKLLDIADARQSALVLAPTASGKTFISFYIMESILRADNDGVVVFVSPTKALAYQVHAEIQARYAKEYSSGHTRSVAGLFTRETRQYPLDCQILVTVPQCLSIYLLSPATCTRRWAARVRYTILDEVHSISKEDGSVWEQLMLFLECPIIALSATLGKAQRFKDWFQHVEARKGRPLHIVEHDARHNDLQPWLFTNGGSIERLHPYVAARASLSIGGLGKMARRVYMVPEDCLRLYDAMVSVLTAAESTPGIAGRIEGLSPGVFFDGVPNGCWDLSMKDAKAWQQAVAACFEDFPRRLQQAVVDRLAKGPCGEQACDESCKVDMLRLGIALKEKDLLPAICFHNCQSGCELYAKQLCRALDEAEQCDLERTGGNLRLLELKKQKCETLKWIRNRPNLRKTADRTGLIQEATEEELQKLDLNEKLTQEIRRLTGVQRDYAMTTRGAQLLTAQEIQDERAEVQRAIGSDHVPVFFWRMLARGIGVHHASLPRAYRQMIERLFRSRKLGLVVSTSTLAVGINMPCRTSVFLMDSIYLDTMTYQQEAGRAGRRGFDLRGNTVFAGIPMEKIGRLVSADLPQISGNRPLTPGLVMRLMLNVGPLTSQEPADLLRGIGRMLDCPLFSPSPITAVCNANMFAFYVQYLQRIQLLDKTQGATQFAGFVAHIFWEEPGNFALVELLRDPSFLEDVSRDRKQLMILLSHLFGRVPLFPAQRRFFESAGEAATRPNFLQGPSIVKLPPMPDGPGRILGDVADRVVRNAVDNLSRFVEVCGMDIQQESYKLPLTRLVPCRMAVNRSDQSEEDFERWTAAAVGAGGYPRVRCPFVALSGRGDEFGGLHELCYTSLSCYRLEPALFPVLDFKETLNSYAFDFYQHGQKGALHVFNGLPETDVWTLLQAFHMVLLTVAVAAEHPSAAATFSEARFVSTIKAVSQQFQGWMRLKRQR